MKIAVDAMGGDHGPAPAVEGAIQAAREFNVDVTLVGDSTQLQDQLRRFHCTDSRITVHHAAQVVGMHESPAQIARKKRDSSIWIATELVQSGEAQAVVSSGNTGASVVSAIFLLERIKGVERPAIATTLPTLTGTAVMLDVGANVDCTANQLLQFAIMGHEYAKDLYDKSAPRIGLLSIGEEDSKGNEVTKEALKLLKSSAINFIGNVEGRDVYSGAADVIVCDGFIGNVALKISEGLAETIKKLLMKEIAGSFLGRLSYPFIAAPLLALKRKTDYAEFGGAPLLGVNGACVIAHGRSSAKAIKNAVRQAKLMVDGHVVENIRRDIEGGPASGPAPAHGETA